jgi:hypothetical protein
MSEGPSERDRIILDIRINANARLVQYYRDKFSNARSEFEDAYFRDDFEIAGKAFMEMNAYNNVLKEIEEYKVKITGCNSTDI